MFTKRQSKWLVPEYPFSVLVIVSYLILLFWRKLNSFILEKSARDITITKQISPSIVGPVVGLGRGKQKLANVQEE